MTQIHTEIKNFLMEQGLTQTEISLYVTSLQFGSETAAKLAKLSGVKRTTTHSALLNLVEKGMMGIHVQAGTSHYTATDPNLIERTFVEKMDILKKQQLDFINLLPLFEDMTKAQNISSEVSSYHGMAGVKTAVDSALYCVSRRWKIISPERNFFSDSDKDYADYFMKLRKQRGIKAQSLWEPAFVKKRTFDEVAFEFRNPKVLPEKLSGKFKATIIIFDSSVIFITSAIEMSAVLIKSQEIAGTMEVFFDGLWASSKAIPKRNIRK
jgi:sugar-specific transcriptional regulator TrmB